MITSFQRLKAALHYTVGRICEKTGKHLEPQPASTLLSTASPYSRIRL